MVFRWESIGYPQMEAIPMRFLSPKAQEGRWKKILEKNPDVPLIQPSRKPGEATGKPPAKDKPEEPGDKKA